MVDTSAVAGAAKWIATSLAEEGKYLYGVEDHVLGLQKDLKYMLQLLQDVDHNPHLTNQDGQLRNFTGEIRELAIRAEDAIDTYIVDVSTKVDRKNLFLKLVCLASHSYPVHKLIKEIEAIRQEIQDAKERFQTFGIIPINTATSQQGSNNNGSSSSRPMPENFIHLDDDVVVGIDDDISQLVERLTDPEDDFKVLAIVGTGGGGKTTLATQLYRHNKVESHFPHKAFVSVSQKWSRTDLLGRIFKQVKGDKAIIPSSESEVVKELHDFIKDKQCLVVLDDIWKKEAWDDIYPIFPRGNKVGWRVILTTRIEEVPHHADNKCVIHEPKLLTEDEQWELFSKVAMEGRPHIEKNDEFVNLGKQMLGKCGGLPLAVVTLAGVLRTKQELYQWEDMSNACTDYILKGKGSSNYGVVEDMLELSYVDLPSYLKPCFLYLGVYPEDYHIPAINVIRFWIAEGFITNDLLRKGHGTLEDAGMRLLNELAQRCILQVRGRNARGQIEKFCLHDLMRELCINKANEYHFLEMISSSSPDVRGPRQPRRMSIYSREYFLEENHHLRTLVFYCDDDEEEDNDEDDDDTDKHPAAATDGVIRNLESIHNKFKLLRVLLIQDVNNDALPKEIGKLIHLRYLGIIDTRILKLPKSIRNLRNLLYLIYDTEDPKEEVEIPNDLVRNMENLRDLDLPTCLKSCPNFQSLGLAGSRNLQSLDCGAGAWMTKELPTLSLTVQNLHINNIQKMEEIEAIYQCPIILEDKLCSLKCHVRDSGEGLQFDLQKLRHCTTLWNLDLDCPLANNGKGMGPIQFPPNLVRLQLMDAMIEQRDDLLQVLGELSKLKFLSLSFDAYLGTRLSCTGSAFPQLYELELEGLDNLKEWRMEEGAMPRLTKIKIDACDELRRLPKSIKSITTLNKLTLVDMPEEFCKRLGYDQYGESIDQGEDSYIIQHIPVVKITCTGGDSSEEEEEEEDGSETEGSEASENSD